VTAQAQSTRVWLEWHAPQVPGRLESLVEPQGRGDPESPMRWTCKSTRTLAGELSRRPGPISQGKATQLLGRPGCSLHARRKSEEGEDHPDRDAQLGQIYGEVRRAITLGEPVILVDARRKEPIGNFDHPVGNGVAAGRQRESTATIPLLLRRRAPARTAFTTRATPGASSAWARTTTGARSRCRRSGAGGNRRTQQRES
jgi:hypothetical protein